MRRTAAVVIMLGLVCASPAVSLAQSSSAERQPTISIGAGYQDSRETFSERRDFTQYLEPATIESLYRVRGSPMVDVGVSWPLTSRFAVQAGASVTNRDADATLIGSIPYPFEFNRPRAVRQSVDDATHREIAIRGELALVIPYGDFVITFSGGPVAMNVRQAFAVGVTVRETEFPFEEVELDVPELSVESGWGIGGTGAADLAWYPSGRVGVAVTGRYTGAALDLRNIDIGAGGPSAVVSVRIRP